MTAATSSQLQRRLGLGDAFFIGVASMVGAGVFGVFAPAAAAAGSALLLGLVLAAIVAWCNATSSAQLAAQYPQAGGTYIYGRERLGEWPGFFAGWSFVIGKTASCAAMAMVFAAYLVPESWQKPTAIGIVWVMVLVNLFGVTRTALVARILVVFSLAGLAIAVVTGWITLPAASGPIFALPSSGSGWYGVLQAAGLLFFAFAGYARIATMGEEVREPERVIPRAIISALTVTLVIYLLVALTLLAKVDVAQLASSSAPLRLLTDGVGWATVALSIGAVAASAGALLGLLTGIGRTWLAMSRNRDLPSFFAVTHPKYQVPHRAEVTLGIILTAVIMVADLRGAIGFSSFGVLLYYFVANLSAFTQDQEQRRYPKAVQILGAVLCVVLVVTLPWTSIVGGLVVLVLGAVFRVLSRGL